MKVKVSDCELFPVYIIDDVYDDEIEISDDVYAEYEKAMKDFRDIQYKVGEIYRNKFREEE